MATDESTARRQVVANISLSLDGKVTGPDGHGDMSWVGPHAISQVARDHTNSLTSATTCVLGRSNYEGFYGYWPAVADDPTADQRDRALARWLNTVEKVVVTTTLTETSWANSRPVDDPVAAVRSLRTSGSGDIQVQNSSSVIRALLEADEVDRLALLLCPEISGGGIALFDGVTRRSSWHTAHQQATESGAIVLTLDRIR